MTRPERLVLIAGTGTEVGKTWVGCEILSRLRASGRRVAARKPAQSFAPGDGPTDADQLAAVTGESPATVCPEHRWYALAMAPFMAADALARPPFLLGELVTEIESSWPDGIDVGVVESAGGVRSPITHDGGDTVDLVRGVRPDVVLLVADAGLGTINAVRLCLDALDGADVVVVLNRFDPDDHLHRANLAWLRGHVGAAVLTSLDEVADRLG